MPPKSKVNLSAVPRIGSKLLSLRDQAQNCLNAGQGDEHCVSALSRFMLEDINRREREPIPK